MRLRMSHKVISSRILVRQMSQDLTCFLCHAPLHVLRLRKCQGCKKVGFFRSDTIASLLVVYYCSSGATDYHRLPHTAADWLKCFCIYRLKCSKATSRLGWGEISVVSTSSMSTALRC